MHYVIRQQGRVSIFIGWMLIVMGILANIVFVVLAIALANALFLVFMPITAMLFIGGAINLRMGRRARLEIQPDQFIWCGFTGAEKSLQWNMVRQIHVPPQGSRRETAAVAELYDGNLIEIQALWKSPTTPSSYLGAPPQYNEEQHALIEGHKAYLARHGIF